MTKKNIFTALLLLSLTLLVSCIREEAPNAECDIIAVKAAWLEENKEILTGKPIISNYDVRFYVNEDAGIDSSSHTEHRFQKRDALMRTATVVCTCTTR